jgi:putative endonuclease
MAAAEGKKGRTGKLGEELAAGHLKNEGYRIVEKNYRCPFGEMDIVARDGDCIVFVEVKSRRSVRYGDPQMAVGARKQETLSKIAQYYLKEKNLHGCRARFDVVAVRILPEGNRIDLIRSAFDLAYGW